MPDPVTDYPDLYPFDDDDRWPEEGDCPACGGSGEVSCNCDDPGCSLCLDGMRTCEGCGGSGFMDRPEFDHE